MKLKRHPLFSGISRASFRNLIAQSLSEDEFIALAEARHKLLTMPLIFTRYALLETLGGDQ